MWVLRASAETLGATIDLNAIVDRSRELGLGNSGTLMDFADACVGVDDGALRTAREALLAKVGPDATTQAAAVVGCFTMNDVAANAIGIRIEGMMLEDTEEMRVSAGLNNFPSARNSLDA